MMRSYALTLSAITLRLCQLFIHQIISLDPTTQYILVSWGSWMFNLGVVEMYWGFKTSVSKMKIRKNPGEASQPEALQGLEVEVVSTFFGR